MNTKQKTSNSKTHINYFNSYFSVTGGFFVQFVVGLDNIANARLPTTISTEASCKVYQMHISNSR